MKKVIACVLSAVLLVSIFAACNGSNSIFNKVADYPATVNNVTIEKKPLTVGSLSPMITDILTDLGYGDEIVAYSSEDELPATDSSSNEESSESAKREIGQIGTVLSPDMEAIGKLKPEVIFTTAPFSKAQMDKLDEVGIKVVILNSASTLQGMYDNLTAIVTVMSGNNDALTTGASIVEETKRQLDYIASKAPKQKKKVLYLKSISPLLAATGDTYESQLLNLVCTNAAESYKNYTLTEEELKALDFDVLLYSSSIKEDDIKANKVFGEEGFLDGKQLIAVDDSLLLDRSKNVADSFRKAAELIYPDIDFKEPVADSSSK